MTNQEQVIADIAGEGVARLRAPMQQPPPAPANGSATAGNAAERRGARFIDVAQASRPATANSAVGDGVFATVDEAANAAAAAQQRVAEMSLEERGKMIAIIRRIRSEEHTSELQ